MRKRSSFLTILAALGGLVGCGQDQGEPPAMPNRDPLLVQALNDQLMVDPDLAQQNEGNAALTISFDRSLPPIDASPATIAVMRDELRMKLLEGGPVLDLPPERERAALRQDESRDLAGTCTSPERTGRSAIWAARLPSHAMIPPRGAVTAAAGADLADCRVRIVTYLTPLPAEEVMQFHYTLASRAGFNPRLLKGRDGEVALRGKRGASELAIVAKPLPDGLAGVDIASVEPAR